MEFENGTLKKVLPTDLTLDGRFVCPKGLTVIDPKAFVEVRDLLTAVDRLDIEEIKPYTFMNCRKLQEILFVKKENLNNQPCISSCGNANGGCEKTKLKRIEDAAFANCISLTKFFVPEGTEHIGRKAFAGCTHLQEMYVPFSVKTVFEGVADGCVEMEKLVVKGCFDNEAFRHKVQNFFRFEEDGMGDVNVVGCGKNLQVDITNTSQSARNIWYEKMLKEDIGYFVYIFFKDSTVRLEYNSMLSKVCQSRARKDLRTRNVQVNNFEAIGRNAKFMYDAMQSARKYSERDREKV